MEQEPQSIWKRPWKGRRALVYWLLVVPVAAFFIACLLSAPSFERHPGGGGYFECVLIITIPLIISIALVFGIGNFVLWVCQWRNFRRFLFGCACVATLIALFYAEEDWRGKYDWNKFKRQCEAKGENFDRNSVVPQQVPDDQNFAMSPVWIADLKYMYPTEPKRAEAWYGDRIYNAEVSNYFRMLPMTVSCIVGTNWTVKWDWPQTPEMSGNWATAQLTDLTPWQSFYRNLQQTNSSAGIAITPKPQTPARDVLLALSKFDPLIERLRQDSELPYSRFPIEYNGEDQDPASILLPHLAAVKQYAQVLELRANAELQNGQSDQALADVKLMFRLADANDVEPFIVSQFVRASVIEIALQPIYEGLARREWSDAQLVELDSGLSKFDFLDAYRFSVHGEAIFLEAGVLDYLRRHPREIVNFSSDTGSPIGNLLAVLMPGGWFYQNELRCLGATENHFLPVVDKSRGVLSPSSIQHAETAVETETRHPNPYNILERMIVPSMIAAARRFAYTENSVNLGRVAIALERYRIARGQYPDSLDVLSQQIRGPIPHDVINGEPLHYQRTADGRFVLYSVGWNETDDGGVVVLKNGAKHGPDGSMPGIDREKGDWVWRYPDR